MLLLVCRYCLFPHVPREWYCDICSVINLRVASAPLVLHLNNMPGCDLACTISSILILRATQELPMCEAEALTCPLSVRRPVRVVETHRARQPGILEERHSGGEIHEQKESALASTSALSKKSRPKGSHDSLYRVHGTAYCRDMQAACGIVWLHFGCAVHWSASWIPRKRPPRSLPHRRSCRPLFPHRGSATVRHGIGALSRF